MRQTFSAEAAAAGLSSKESTHLDLIIKWNSRHEMCQDGIRKHIVLDSIRVT